MNEREFRPINDATLESLRLRIGAQINGRILRSAGISFGGVGAVFSLVTLLAWLPEAAIDHLRRDPAFMSTMSTSVGAYLESDDGERMMHRQIENLFASDASLSAYIAEVVGLRLTEPGPARDALEAQVTKIAGTAARKTVERELSKPEARRQLERSVGDATVQLVSGDRGLELLREVVAGRLDSEDLGSLISGIVKAEMKRATDALGSQLIANKSDLVRRLQSIDFERGAAGAGAERVSKESVGALRSFLSSDRVEELQSSGKPIALTFKIGRGRVYAAGAIREYLDSLKQTFGREFEIVLVHGPDDELLASSTPGHFGRELDDDLMAILNSDAGGFDEREMRQRLETTLGAPSIRQIDASLQLLAALRADVWASPDQLDIPHLVVDESGTVLGTTTRGALIDQILG